MIYITKKFLKSLSKKKLVDLIYKFNFRIFKYIDIDSPNYINYEYRVTDIAPGPTSVISEFHQLMVDGEVSPEEYLGAVKFKNLVKEEFRDLCLRRMQEEAEDMEKIGWLKLIEKEKKNG